MQDEENKKSEFELQLAIDMSIDGYNLIDESRNIPNVMQRYTDLIRLESRKLSKVKLKYEEVFHKNFIYFLKEHDIKFNTTDARRLAESEEKALKLKKLMYDFEDTVTYLKNIMWNLKAKQTSIGHMIQVKKMELS
jgi:hypothetical protein